MATLFISDLHLSNERPLKLELFLQFMLGPAQRAEALYILGDLIEVWAGDDDPTPPHPWLVETLQAYTAAGGRLYVMRGNRDFLMGERFCTETGATLLTDPGVIDLGGRRTLVMHGDLLCTQDKTYQYYRRVVQSAAFQKCFLLIPLGLRLAIAHGFRRLTRNMSRDKPDNLTDVDQKTVESCMRDHDVQLLIHGHTHRPGIHDFELEGKPARRIVLGDWYEQDSVLISDERGERLVRVGDLL